MNYFLNNTNRGVIILVMLLTGCLNLRKQTTESDFNKKVMLHYTNDEDGVDNKKKAAIFLFDYMEDKLFSFDRKIHQALLNASDSIKQIRSIKSEQTSRDQLATYLKQLSKQKGGILDIKTYYDYEALVSH